MTRNRFSKWIADHHKLPRDPLASIKKPNPQADRRYERRMLLPEESHILEAATKSAPERCGVTGEERALLYATAIQTGLRSSELRSLNRRDLYLDADPPYITCKAGSTKNRELARQYIQPELATDLKAHVGAKSPKAPVFTLPHETNMAKMLRADLAETRNKCLIAARNTPHTYASREEDDFLAAVNHNGEFLDFHALRHTCGAWMAMSGVHPKVVQTVMRHQSITLTMHTYVHMFPGQEVDAVGRMRGLLETLSSGEPLADVDDAAAEATQGARCSWRSNQDAISADTKWLKRSYCRVFAQRRPNVRKPPHRPCGSSV